MVSTDGVAAAPKGGITSTPATPASTRRPLLRPTRVRLACLGAIIAIFAAVSFVTNLSRLHRSGVLEHRHPASSQRTTGGIGGGLGGSPSSSWSAALRRENLSHGPPSPEQSESGSGVRRGDEGNGEGSLSTTEGGEVEIATDGGGSKRDGGGDASGSNVVWGSEGGASVQDEDDDYRSETAAFQRVLQRSRTNRDGCNALPVPAQPVKTLVNASNVPLLPEFGVVDALSRWMDKGKGSGNGGGREQCQIPPPRSCDVTSYSVVLMSHTTDRLPKLMGPLSDLASRPGAVEVILVWNAKRDVLAQDKNGHGPTLLSWDQNASHPFRIFFALESGLENNLLNRYHPSIRPKSEAVMYFDDDGPFWSDEAMGRAGFELWKRNSDVQVGGFPRNLRFLSDRMKKAQSIQLERSIMQVKDGWQSDHPPPASGGDGVGNGNGAGNKKEQREFPQFVPTCRERTGDVVEYNYFVFPQYVAHILLPSGSILHRNYLCFIWHPAFDEVRRYVLDHPTHPDDMTISTIVSHLAGRAPRVFPREISQESTTAAAPKKRRRRLGMMEEGHGDGPADPPRGDGAMSNTNLIASSSETTMSGSKGVVLTNDGAGVHSAASRGKSLQQINAERVDAGVGASLGDRARTIDDAEFAPDRDDDDYHSPMATVASADQSHRRLLWRQKNWAPMREEAINSIVGYFGSINPGSVGWCVGTDRQKRKPRQGTYDCDPEKPSLNMVPWLNEGGVGFDQC